ncbi:hypothetical protein H1P_4990004 [Hyella patelloides LEGE 07179]|uniref:Uncharacterized protein n=1 Tax=Hyella patelloides LEGE 07179 TaxID=945734 RepID=A0A563VZV1_9CYAN|nr:hypothetical protein H1P_4990004 [Hyella patelloides LEGE 07179]
MAFLSVIDLKCIPMPESVPLSNLDRLPAIDIPGNDKFLL